MSIFKVTRYGFFGKVLTGQILTIHIFSLVRTFNREEFYLFGRKIFVRPLPLAFSQASMINSVFSRQNRETLRQQSKTKTSTPPESLTPDLNEYKSFLKRKVILLMTDHLASVGGAETRIVRTADLLSELNFVPMILCQHNAHTASQKFPNLILDYRDPHLGTVIGKWIDEGLIHGIEFHVKNPRVLYDLPLFDWKDKIMLGAQIHNLFALTKELKQQFEYCHYIVSSQLAFVPKTKVIRNWIDASKSNSFWSYKNQKKALLISRLSKDKRIHISRFVDFCRRHGLDFHIASDWPRLPWQRRFLSSLELNDAEFIGPVSSNSYLRHSAGQYLFIAGIGQVPLEAASLGIPTAVMSSKSEKEFQDPLVFLEKDNLPLLEQWNFVINQCPIHTLTPNAQRFMQNQTTGAIREEFFLEDELKNLRTPNDLIEVYERCYMKPS
ncbi:hypothetical protein [Turicimonas muris]|uniref:hypothetical protein n=1 Tax=Turicimonas muris TaxID=1796652 RepID=UPI00266ECE4C|nr:hypothetical protein [Turicimonas muris]